MAATPTAQLSRATTRCVAAICSFARDDVEVQTEVKPTFVSFHAWLFKVACELLTRPSTSTLDAHERDHMLDASTRECFTC